MRKIKALLISLFFAISLLLFSAFSFSSLTAYADGEKLEINRVGAITPFVTSEEGVQLSILLPDNAIRLTVDPDLGIPFDDKRQEITEIAITDDGLGHKIAAYTGHWNGWYEFFCELDTAVVISKDYHIVEVDTNPPAILSQTSDDFYYVSLGGLPNLLYQRISDYYISYPQSAASGVKDAYVFRIQTDALPEDISATVLESAPRYKTKLTSEGGNAVILEADIDQAIGYYYCYAVDNMGFYSVKYLFYIGDYDNLGYDFVLNINGEEITPKFGLLLNKAQEMLTNGTNLYKEAYLKTLESSLKLLLGALDDRKNGGTQYGDAELYSLFLTATQDFNRLVLAETENRTATPTVEYTPVFKADFNYPVTLKNKDGVLPMKFGETLALVFNATDKNKDSNEYKWVSENTNSTPLAVFDMTVVGKIDGVVYLDLFNHDLVFQVTSSGGLVYENRIIGDIKIYKVSANGTLETAGETTLSNGFSLNIKQSGQYVICFYEKENDGTINGFPVWAIVLLSVSGGALVIGGTVLIIVSIKRKNKKRT